MVLYDIDIEGQREEWLKVACMRLPLSTGAAPILFQTEVTVTPSEEWRDDWRDEATGGQDPSVPVWLTMGCFCLLNGGFVYERRG